MSLLTRGAGALNDFVDVLRQVRVDDIEAEAQRHFQIAIAGLPGAGKTTLVQRLAGSFGVLEPFGARRLLELDAPLSGAALEAACQSDLVIWLRDLTQPHTDEDLELLRRHAPAFLSVGNKADLAGIGDWEAGLEGNAHFALPNWGREAIAISALSGESVRHTLIPAIVEALPDFSLALGRTFATFRSEVTRREIQRVARVNAEVAVVSAIPQASIILGPASALADTLILTKNQAILLLRLAAVHGLPLDRTRLTELASVVGAAFGWRTLARELVGFLPAGLGVVPKAAIAYAGTLAAGRAAAWYYETGRALPEAQLRLLRKASLSEAKQTVQGIAQRFKRAG
jgi:uncharacterized protein (DUF697 family)